MEKKERKYLDDIKLLKEEYEINKKKVLDEGCALGYANTVLREFKWFNYNCFINSLIFLYFDF